MGAGFLHNPAVSTGFLHHQLHVLASLAVCAGILPGPAVSIG
jgi:hypothetical protein